MQTTKAAKLSHTLQNTGIFNSGKHPDTFLSKRISISHIRNDTTELQEQVHVPVHKTHLKWFIILNGGEHLVAILSDAPGSHLHQWLLGVACLHGAEQLLHGVSVQRCCLCYQLDGDCHHVTSDVVPSLQQRRRTVQQ